MSAETPHENGELEGKNAMDANALPGIGSPARVGHQVNSLAGTRRELAKLYRETRRREGRYPDALTAMRLANVLGALRDAIANDELRQRIEQIEARLGSASK